MTSRAAAGRRRQGVPREKPIDLASVPTIFIRQDFEPSGQGAMAPASIDRSGSGTIFSGSTPISVPRPEQVGQAPYGLLNENSRGVISVSPVPHSAQEQFCDSVSSAAPSGAST